MLRGSAPGRCRSVGVGRESSVSQRGYTPSASGMAPVCTFPLIRVRSVNIG